jgi:hypothetical protein
MVKLASRADSAKGKGSPPVWLALAAWDKMLEAHQQCFNNRLSWRILLMCRQNDPTEAQMKARWITILWLLAVAFPLQQLAADEPSKSGANPFGVHKNHVKKTSGDYLACFRRIAWHYDFATASALARETRRPMFVIFCRAGTIDDPLTGQPKCAS